MIKAFLRKALFTMNGRAVRVNGRPFKLPEKLISHFNVRQNNPMEPELCAVIDKLLKPGDIFVDIGANVGVLSLLASERVGQRGSVIAIEPNPATFGLLSEIIALNKKHDNFIMLQVAVADKAGVLPLQINSGDSVLMERSSIVHHEQGTDRFDVFTNSLENIIPAAIHPTLIKVDVEGAELVVLEGAKGMLANVKPMVCIEVHGLYFDDIAGHVNNVFTFFDTLGYSCVNIFKGKVEAAKSFLIDSGVPGVDPQTGKNLNTLGYGNLIFTHGEAQTNEVATICKQAKKQ